MLEPTPIRQRKRLRAFALGTGTLIVAMLLSTLGLGEGTPAVAGVLGLCYALLAGGLLALAYLAGGVALGAAALRWLPATEHKPWLILGLGPGLMLFASHALGVLGLLSGPRGQWVAIATLALGAAACLAILMGSVRRSPNLPRPPTTAFLWILPAAVILVAASNPPGWLWRSEASGYDALSYHLQLPQEWAAGVTAPRLWPLKHNVYSFLPSYVESGFTHLAAALGAGSAAGARPGNSVGLLAREGAGAIACQLLHAAFGLISAVLLSRVVWTLLRNAGIGGRAPAEIAALSGAVLLATPWVIVVSSMAYNEAAVNALMTTGMLAALDSRLGPAWRGVLTGAAVGIATGCKPTAAFLVAPVVGLLLLGMLPPRLWCRAVLAGALLGIAMIAPFLVRNYLACGNPVFPAGTAWFGTAHWTAEQVERFQRAHAESSGLASRLGLLLQATTNAPDAGLGGEPRGIFHSQWMGLYPLAAFALAVAALWRGTRLPALLLGLGAAAGIVWWLGWSHCQSRFLLPHAVVIAAASGLALGRVAAWLGTSDAIGGETAGAKFSDADAVLARRALLVASVLPMLLAVASTRKFLMEQAPERAAGLPNVFLPSGTAIRTGDSVMDELRSIAEPERPAYIASLGPESRVNNFVDSVDAARSRVLLVGGATPFYYRGAARGRVIYNTTYDASPLAATMRASPEEPERWGEALRAKGIEYLVIDFGEISRLGRDGWIEPELSLERVAGWIVRTCVPVAEWPTDRAPGSMPLIGLYRILTPAEMRGEPGKERSS